MYVYLFTYKLYNGLMHIVQAKLRNLKVWDKSKGIKILTYLPSTCWTVLHTTWDVHPPNLEYCALLLNKANLCVRGLNPQVWSCQHHALIHWFSNFPGNDSGNLSMPSRLSEWRKKGSFISIPSPPFTILILLSQHIYSSFPFSHGCQYLSI